MDFERLNLVAHGRCSHMQFLRRLTEAAMAGSGLKGTEGVKGGE